MPSENTPFTPSSILFRPRIPANAGGSWVEPPGTAPGSDGFITIAFYRHSRSCPQHPEYRAEWLRNKDRRNGSWRDFGAGQAGRWARPSCLIGNESSYVIPARLIPIILFPAVRP